MKAVIVILVTFATNLAFATDVNTSAVAAHIVCSAPQARIPEVRQFEMTKLNTDSPETTLRESFQEYSLSGDVFTVSFSDECEAWYAVDLKMSDLVALRRGAVSSITGMLRYNELAENFPDIPVDQLNAQSAGVDDSSPISCVARP